MIRTYQVQYEMNRLSNIIEEEDSNLEEEQETPNLDMQSVEDYKEMLKLGEQVTSLYENIKNELNKPAPYLVDTSYRPVMKKRVYNLNRSYMSGNEEPSMLSLTNVTKSSSLIRDTESEEEPDSILNYLIGRLSEQHKSKLEPILNTATVSSSKLSAEFDEFEKHLYEKYALKGAEVQDQEDTKLLQTKLPLNDTGYILTRSLYAQHKTINLDDEAPQVQMRNKSSNPQVLYSLINYLELILQL